MVRQKANDCMCIYFIIVKAVHLELVSDLMSEAFIAALCRFISQREYPKQIHSDNGTNFIGVNHSIDGFYAKISIASFGKDGPLASS